MKSLLLAATTLFLISGADAREHWGPPPACPQPKVDCCPKPCPPKPCAKPSPQKPCAKPCPPKPCAKPSPQKPCAKPCPPKPCSKECPPKLCKPKPCKPQCPPPANPCCPPVCFERGHETSKCCLPSGFVEPANYDTRCGADFYFTASFLYWEVMQGGMDIALPGQAASINPLGADISLPATGGQVLYQDREFKPAFKLGAGWTGGWDGWSFYGEYTWVRGETHKQASAPNPDVATLNGVSVPAFGVWIPSSWFPSVYTNNVFTSISSEWNYAIDIADIEMSRPSYIGTRFIFEPFFGLRGLWVRQSVEMTANVLPYSGPSQFPNFRKAHYHSHSWAVGPRAGLNGNWQLGYGLRFIGNTSASLLFTQFDVNQKVDSPDPTELPVQMKLDDYNCLRPNMDLSVGLGWGSYFWCRRVHLDLAATYDFSIFWEQNMMRYVADLTSNLTAHPAATPQNLYIQGFTLKAAFEF